MIIQDTKISNNYEHGHYIATANMAIPDAIQMFIKKETVGYIQTESQACDVISVGFCSDQ